MMSGSICRNIMFIIFESIVLFVYYFNEQLIMGCSYLWNFHRVFKSTYKLSINTTVDTEIGHNSRFTCLTINLAFKFLKFPGR